MSVRSQAGPIPSEFRSSCTRCAILTSYTPAIQNTRSQQIGSTQENCAKDTKLLSRKRVRPAKAPGTKKRFRGHGATAHPSLCGSKLCVVYALCSPVRCLNRHKTTHQSSACGTRAPKKRRMTLHSKLVESPPEALLTSAAGLACPLNVTTLRCIIVHDCTKWNRF